MDYTLTEYRVRLTPGGFIADCHLCQWESETCWTRNDASELATGHLIADH